MLPSRSKKQEAAALWEMAKELGVTCGDRQRKHSKLVFLTLGLKKETSDLILYQDMGLFTSAS